MNTLKIGDKGPDVAEAQKLLSLLGYDLVIDGMFGPRTLRSLNAFQKKNGLKIDGEVGEKTYQSLKAAQKNTAKELKGVNNIQDYESLKIIKTKELSSNQYIKQVFPKTEIFIHFTAGGPAAVNSIAGWDADEPRIAVAFVIDGDTGEIHEAFNPSFWSFHLGIKGTNGKLDKISIGIEICAWGPLTKVGDKFYNYKNKEVPSEQVYILETPFRGYNYFHKYTEAQLNSLEELLTCLVKKYNINIQKNFDNSWFNFNQSVIDNCPPGIYTHVNVRKDKTDSYPDERLIDLLNRVSKKINA